MLRYILGKSLQQANTLFRAGLLSPSEQDHCLDLVARLQESLSALSLGFVVVGVNFQAEANLLKDGIGLITPCLLGLLCFFILELAVVHDFRDGRLGVGSYLNQIQVCLLSKSERYVDGDDAHLLAGWADKSDLRNADSVIGTGIADASLLCFIVKPRPCGWYRTATTERPRRRANVTTP